MKFYGTIGYAVTEETAPSVWTPTIKEVNYRGDILQFSRKLETAGVNDNLNVSNRVSIVGDPFAFENFQNIKYVTWMNTKWKVPSVEVDFPRLILTIGGVYNE